MRSPSRLRDPCELATHTAARRALVLGVALAYLQRAVCAATSVKPQGAPMVLPRPARHLIESSGLASDNFGLHVQPMVRSAAAPPLSLNAERPFQMASTIKLVTALAALDLLGPAYRWLNHAHLDGALHEGRLLGDLIIAGGGDPSLSVESLRRWFTELRERGLREVWGDIVLAHFAFDLSERDHAHTPPLTPDQPRHARPDALMLDAGRLRIGLRSLPREPALVHLVPRQAGLPVVNHVTPGPHRTATAQFEQRAGEERLIVRGEWAPLPAVTGRLRNWPSRMPS